MKNNSLKNKPYNKIIYKIFFQMLAILLIAMTIVIILRSAVQGKIGNIIATFMSKTLDIEWVDAQILYWNYVRSNLFIFIIIAIVLLFLIFFRIYLSLFTKYFDEMISGVDKLTEESNDNIVMAPELNFMEQKLNQVKNTLEAKTKASKEAEKRKNDLIMYLAHDIKTPLTSVIGYLSLLDEVPDMPIKQRAKYTHITLEKAYRLEQLINEFFDITRYNLENIVLERKEIDLNYMLMQMADEFFPVLNPSGKKAIVEANEDITIKGDPDKLARVFNNILKNAATYSSPNTTINIFAKAYENQVIVEFRNIGETIPRNQLSSIFEKFYRLDTSRSTSTGGSGLGLAIAKEIVTLHNGDIKVTSNNGITIFKVTLPM